MGRLAGHMVKVHTIHCLYFFLTPNYQLSNKVKQRNKEKTHKRIPFKRKLIPHFLNASHP